MSCLWDLFFGRDGLYPFLRDTVYIFKDQHLYTHYQNPTFQVTSIKLFVWSYSLVSLVAHLPLFTRVQSQVKARNSNKNFLSWTNCPYLKLTNHLFKKYFTDITTEHINLLFDYQNYLCVFATGLLHFCVNMPVCPFWPGVVAPDRVLSMCQMKLFDI